MVPSTAAAATTGRPYRQQEHCQRLVNFLPAPQSPLPLVRLPLVEATAVGIERTKATTATTTTGRRHCHQ